MQREDVERLEADLLRLAYECDEQGEGWQEDGPLLREAATALRALLAERDAAFAAGQESMRERAADATLYLCRMKGMGNRTIDGPEASHLICNLTIKPRP